MRGAIATGLAILSFAVAPEPANAAARHRLPKGYHWGRCLLIADGQIQISVKCAYELREHGGFYITGPHQIYEGIDYYNPEHFGALEQSRDYWAVVYREADGNWWGYGTNSIYATHGNQGYEKLTQKGACFEGAIGQGGTVRICLWRK